MNRTIACIALAAAVSVWPVDAQEQEPPARGPATASAQIEVFLSFDSEPSANLSVVLDTLHHRRPDDVRIIFRHLPPADDEAGIQAHRAALAAAGQGKFWEMAGLLFANQERRGRDVFAAMALQLRLDAARFAADFDGPAADGILAADRERAARLGVTNAPALVINGRRVDGIRTLQEVEALLP